MRGNFKMKKVLWQEMRRGEFKVLAERDGIVIIPVGSTEQHGEHLPVNTDTNCCFAIAVRAAEVIDNFPVIVLPPVWSGYSPHHMCFAGTITLEFHTFVEVLTQIAVGVSAHGFRKIILLNGHGGNAAIVAAMRNKLLAEKGIAVLGYTYWEMPSVADEMRRVSESDKGFIGHASEIETSMQLHLQPELVDVGAARWVPGVWGNPATGDPKKGEKIIDAAVRALVTILIEVHSGQLQERLKWREEVL